MLALLCVPSAAVVAPCPLTGIVPVSPAPAASLLTRAGVPLWPLQQVCIPCQWQERLSEASASLPAPLSARRMLAQRRKHMCGLEGSSVAALLDTSLARHLSYLSCPFIPVRGGEQNLSASLAYF